MRSRRQNIKQLLGLNGLFPIALKHYAEISPEIFIIDGKLFLKMIWLLMQQVNLTVLCMVTCIHPRNLLALDPVLIHQENKNRFCNLADYFTTLATI